MQCVSTSSGRYKARLTARSSALPGFAPLGARRGLGPVKEPVHRYPASMIGHGLRWALRAGSRAGASALPRPGLPGGGAGRGLAAKIPPRILIAVSGFPCPHEDLV